MLLQPATVLGSGPVALAHALFSARHRRVVLVAWQPSPAPSSGPALGVESVPAPLLTLLLELGVHPGELDVEELHRRRLVAWEGADPQDRPARASAHVERSALLAALWRRVDVCAGIRVVTPGSGAAIPPARGAPCVDARGRTAAGHGWRVRPPRAWIAASCTVERRDLDGSLRLAAAPGGYGFRLGSATFLTVGWVAPGPSLRSAEDLQFAMRAGGAGWLLDDVVLDQPLRHRVASLSVAGDPAPAGVLRLGDAALARDALASQGLATGLSDARLAAQPEWTAGDTAERTADGLRRHVRSLTGVLETCRHRHEPAWQAYSAWVRSISSGPES